MELFEGNSTLYATILVDPPWSPLDQRRRPGHRVLRMQDVQELPVTRLAAARSHLYLWSPNSLIPHALDVMKTWGFVHQTSLIWIKTLPDGRLSPERGGVYFRNATEMLLFGVRGEQWKRSRSQLPSNAVLAPRSNTGRPDEIYRIIQRCSRGPFLELFARTRRPGWDQWPSEPRMRKGAVRNSRR